MVAVEIQACPSNDTAVQRRTGEGAKRPTRSSDCNGGLGAVLLKSLSNTSDCDHHVVMVLAEEPTEILGDQVVLKAVALPDDPLGHGRCRVIHGEVRQLVILRDEPDPRGRQAQAL